jgi:hypothetical protein
MQATVDAYPVGSRPLLLFGGLPLPAGLLTNGAVLPFRDWDNASANLGYLLDTPFMRNVYGNFAAAFPPTQVVDFAAFDQERFAHAYHTDIVHYSTEGSARVGQIVADAVNILNQCVPAAGAEVLPPRQSDVGLHRGRRLHRSECLSAALRGRRRLCGGRLLRPEALHHDRRLSRRGDDCVQPRVTWCPAASSDPRCLTTYTLDCM